MASMLLKFVAFLFGKYTTRLESLSSGSAPTALLIPAPATIAGASVVPRLYEPRSICPSTLLTFEYAASTPLR